MQDEGTARHSIVSKWLDETAQLNGAAALEEREFFKSFAATTYLGGADTVRTNCLCRLSTAEAAPVQYDNPNVLSGYGVFP